MDHRLYSRVVINRKGRARINGGYRWSSGDRRIAIEFPGPARQVGPQELIGLDAEPKSRVAISGKGPFVVECDVDRRRGRKGCIQCLHADRDGPVGKLWTKPVPQYVRRQQT